MTDEELREKMACPGGYRPSIEEVNLLSVEIDRLRAELKHSIEGSKAEYDELQRLKAENAALRRIADVAERLGMNVAMGKRQDIINLNLKLREALIEWRNRGEG